MSREPNPPAPTDWHKRPNGTRGACPICGCPTLNAGFHRSYKPEEGMRALWVKRQKSLSGWREIPIFAPGDSAQEIGQALQAKHPKPPRAPKPETIKAVMGAAKLEAFGFTAEEAAEKLGIPRGKLRDYRERYADLWTRHYVSALASVTKAVRKLAGTEAVFDDLTHYLRMAENADRWTMQNGEPLFPSSTGTTLTGFYNGHYLPNQLSDAAPKTFESYQAATRKWAYLTGDPPLSEITSDMMARFRNGLGKCSGKKPGTRMSPNTTRGILRHIQAILNKAGPAGPRNRDAAELITRVPWTKPPREDLGEPRIVTPDELQACYLAATAMDAPRFPGIKAPAWWRALLVTAYNTGMRRGNLFSMRMDQIDWRLCQIVLPARKMKARKLHVVHLNGSVLEHLRAIRTDRELVFPLEHWPKWFYDQFHKLQAAAGIPRSKQFGLHALRKTCATLLWGVAPQAAQLALGHAAANVTMRHYIAAGGIVAKALDLLPQPWLAG